MKMFYLEDEWDELKLARKHILMNNNAYSTELINWKNREPECKHWTVTKQKNFYPEQIKEMLEHKAFIN